jgi:GNAT superfamily N-acetyltransferase
MIRAGDTRDYDAFLRLSRELGTDDPEPTREAWERNLMPGMTVFERAGEVVGYTIVRWLPDAAHVMHVAVAPEARRSGVGRALMEHARARVRVRGLREWHLNVKVGNAPARALYESLAMQPLHPSAFTRVPWACVAALPAEPAVFSLAEPAEDSGLEARFGLLAGRLTANRARGGRVLAKLCDAAGAPLGVASFDPDHPGAFPFCVARPVLARTLLEGLQPYARPADAYLGVGVENDEGLVDTLVAAGAEVRMRIVHYRGEP